MEMMLQMKMKWICKLGWLRVQDAKGKDKLLVGQTGGEVFLIMIIIMSPVIKVSSS